MSWGLTPSSAIFTSLTTGGPAGTFSGPSRISWLTSLCLADGLSPLTVHAPTCFRPELRRRRIRIGKSALSRFFGRHGNTLKKTISVDPN